jgi:DNA-binding HxlR family transcriptional regulator
MNKDCAAHIRRVSQVTVLLEGKWKLQILCAMRSEPVRLSQLTRSIPSASKKALRAALRGLELTGIVVRRDLSDIVLHVEYDFADNSREIVCALLDNLAIWGDRLVSQERIPPE